MESPVYCCVHVSILQSQLQVKHMKPMQLQQAYWEVHHWQVDVVLCSVQYLEQS